MKKTISINISGIVFYIEEDGYEKLNNYLLSIQQYFAGYEGNKEIIADIESRIAEIFFAKINPAKQVITLDDVNALIATMGSISDFDAIESDEYANNQTKNSTFNAQSQTNSSPSKKLVRDEKRKTLGGVASGIAHYLKIDPLWIRLIFILGTSIYGSFLVAYIILWVAVPGAKDLEDDEKVKKFYRDPEKKVIGGVASGLAAYFGGDSNTLTIIRIVLIISFCFFGAGFYFYTILWIITPVAKTVTEKMQMHGQPVTLSNIEKNIKKNLNAEDEKEESLGIKILLFPFRLISQIVSALSPLVGSILKVMVAFAGIVILIVSFFLIVVLIIILGAYLSLVPDHYVHLGSLPTYLLSSTISPALAVFTFLSLLFPIIMVGMLGMTLISGRSLFNKRMTLAFVGIWIISIIGISITGLNLANQFRKQGKIEETVNYNIKGNQIALTSLENDEDDEIRNFLNFSINGYDGNSVKLEKIYVSQGIDKNDAINNAKMISYNVQQKNDSVLFFDEKYELKKDSKFRAQHLVLRLYIPYDQIFTADEHFINLMNSRHQIGIHKNYNRSWDFKWEDDSNNDDINVGEKYKFTNKDGLVCVTCKNGSGIRSTTRLNNRDEFDRVEVNGAFEVKIKQGDSYNLEIDAPKDIKNKISSEVTGSTLKIDYEEEFLHNFNFNNHFRRPVIFITMPVLERFELSGASKGHVSGFNNHNDMEVELSGASEADMNVNTNNLDVNINGASSLKISGTSNDMNIDVFGASHLDAFDLKAERVKADVNGASSAKINVTKEIEAHASGAGHISYRGNPSVINKDESGAGSINKE